MKNNFRIAIIGAGMISRNAHLPVALSIDCIDVVAIVDSNKQRANDLARDFGLDVMITSNVADISDIADGAIIATPNHTHRDIAVTCLDANVSVLIEKPMTDSVSSALDIVECEKKSASIVAVGYVSRFRENVRFLHELLDQKYFGRVRRFHHQFGTPGGWSPESAYYLRGSEGGSGVLTVSGTHFLDRMLMLWGSPDFVEYADDGATGIEANCHAAFRFDSDGNDLHGTVSYSKTTYLPAGLILETDRGIVIIDDTDDADILLFPKDNPNIAQALRSVGSRNESQDTFQLQLLDFIRAANSGSEPEIDSSQGLASVRLLHSLYSSKKLKEPTWYEDSEIRVES